MGIDNEHRPESVLGSETRDGGSISIRRRSFITTPVVLVMRRKEAEEAALVIGEGGGGHRELYDSEVWSYL